jgi:ABC-type glycerol-3-phosphate transport system substrate-binding protein
MHLNAAADVLRSQGIGVAVTGYLPEERDAAVNRKLSLFAAGMGPDIFLVDGAIYRFIDNGFLMDINELIPDRTLLYENALAGFEVGGRLYALPMDFGFNMVGINSSLPPEVISRFAALETASVTQLMGIYAYLISTYPQFADFYFTNLFWPAAAMEEEIGHALNFSAGTVAFAEGTARLFYNLRTHVQDNHNPIYLHSGSHMEIVEPLHDNTVFHVPRIRNMAANAFFPFERDLFAHYIPVTDERGILIDRSAPIAVAVSADADPETAWAFIEALMSETAMNMIGRGGNIHIVRDYALGYLQRGIYFEAANFPLRPFSGSTQEAVSAAATGIMAFAERIHLRPLSRFLMPSNVTYPTKFHFLEDSTVPASEAIRGLERELLAWMGRTAPIIAYVPAPVPPPVDEPFVRTLTIHADNRHLALLRQAERAMNESWQAQGKEYTFRLALDTWSWTNVEAVLEQWARMNMELMTGRGPDIFIAQQGFNMRAFAQNGFLADFYALIDACEHTTRSDFFENILQALEFDGGLYMFPTSFGFHQVGINSSIPQNYVAEHTARDTITIQDMYRTYVSVRSHPDYAHLHGGILVGNWPHLAIQSAMTPFMNFETRSVNFTDPRFLESLELIRNVFDGRSHIVPQGATVYEMSFSRTRAATPFLPLASDDFTEYRLLTDEAGRLIINPFHEPLTWALLSVTAAGQPQLAWEFIVHLLREYPRAEGHARVQPGIPVPTFWAGQSIATPILRENADMPRQMLELVTSPQSYRFADWSFYNPVETYIDAAMERLAQLNEMPVVMDTPLIPTGVYAGPDYINMYNFLLGAITVEAFAMMLQNSLTLWLMEVYG